MNELELKLQQSLQGQRVIDRTLLDRGVIGRGVIGRGALDRGALDRGALGRGALDRGALGRGALGRGALGRGALDRGALDRGALDRGALDHGHCGPSRRPAVTGVLHKELSYAIVGAAIEVHRHLGPGQFEATYERALAKELGNRGIAYRTQVPLTTRYKGDAVGDLYADLIVDEKVIIELKSVAAVHYVHKLQVVSYLRASGLRLGLLINFNTPVLYRAIDRIVL